MVYGITKKGESVEKYVLRAGRFSVSVITYGAILLEWLCYHEMGSVMTEEGLADNFVLTLPSLSAYEDNPAYVGCVVGRYGGRIKQGDLSRAGFKNVQLDQNDRGNCLHGGYEGFNKKVWQVNEVTENTIEMSYESASGEGGFPGRLTATVRYTLEEHGALKVVFTGTADEDTVFAPTQHTYFNLEGWQKDTVLQHKLSMGVNQYWTTDDTSAPSECVWNSNLLHELRQFEDPSTIAHLHSAIELEQHTDKGFDYPFELRASGQAVLTSSDGKRKLTVKTNCPYVVVYAGGWLDTNTSLIVAESALPEFKKPQGADAFYGICFETQDMPNGPFLAGVGPWHVTPGGTYNRETIYQISI